MNAYNTYSDQELVALMKQGDHAAFNEVYDRYAKKLYYQINKMLRDEDAAKDLVQELFITVWNKAANIREDAKLGGYLYIAAQNSVFKYIEKGKSKHDFMQSLASFLTELDNSGTERLEEKELSMLIDKAIAALPVKMREIFELSRKEEMSYQEIADQLQISTQTVKNQVSSALKILREKTGPNIAIAVFVAGFLDK